MSRVPTTGAQRYCLEIDPRSQAQLQVWLRGQGVEDIRVIVPGYVSAILGTECYERVRLMRGVRRVLLIEEEVVISMSGSGTGSDSDPVGARFKVGDTVSILGLGFSVVGRIEELGNTDAKVVITLFGRALRHTVDLTVLQPVAVPEVWR